MVVVGTRAEMWRLAPKATASAAREVPHVYPGRRPHPRGDVDRRDRGVGADPVGGRQRPRDGSALAARRAGDERRSSEPEIVENTYVRNVPSPSLTVFPADPRHANGAAVIVVPGGGHRMLVFVNRGVGPAKALNRYGVTTFVLEIPPGARGGIDRCDRPPRRRRPAPGDPLGVASAAQYGVDPRRIGVMGFRPAANWSHWSPTTPRRPGRRRPIRSTRSAPVPTSRCWSIPAPWASPPAGRGQPRRPSSPPVRWTSVAPSRP